MNMEVDDPATSSSLEGSSASNGSSSTTSNSLDTVDDASSTNSSSSANSNGNGPLFKLSERMAQLPKRGLSKCYQGKSQSFTSLSRAMSIQDLAKKETPHRKKIKACKSYGGGLDVKATISKKAASSSRGSFSSLLSCSSGSRRGSFFCNSNNNNRLPPIPVQEHF